MAFVSTTLASTIARADRPDVATRALVIEAHVGQRPPDADKVLRPLRHLLHEHGISAEPDDIIENERDELPVPGFGLDEDVTATRIRDELKLGYTAFSKGRFHDAIDRLDRALAWANANPALVAGLDNVTDNVTKMFTMSYAALAMSYLKRNPTPTADDTKLAHAAWAEQMRYFPSVPMPRETFGPEGDDLANATRKELAPLGTGRLIVVVNRGDAQIHLGPVVAARGGMFAASVIPGDYVVYVDWQGSGRRYVARVRAGQEIRLEIKWEQDSRLVVSRKWVGYLLESDQRNALDGHVTDLIRQHVRVGSVSVLTFDVVHGRRYLTVTSFTSSVGQKLDAVRIELGGDREPARIAELAAWIYARKPSPDVVAVDPAEEARANAEPTVSTSSRIPRIPALSYLSAGAAIPVAGAGVYLLHLNGRGTCPAGTADDCPQVYKTAPPAWALIGTGVGLVGFAVYWALHSHGSAHEQDPMIGFEPARRGGTIVVGWSM